MTPPRGSLRLALLLLVSLPALPAAAATSVSLQASAAAVEHGQAVTLSGTVSPPAAGETVSLVDEPTGAVLATPTTDAAGAYSASIVPDRNLRVRASAPPASSAPVDVGVRPLLSVALSPVDLFAEAAVQGTIVPPHPGSAVTVRLLSGGAVVAEASAPVDAAGVFRASLPILRPGTYTAEAVFADADHLPASALSEPRSTKLPRLSDGARGDRVKLLERRLRQLRYHLPGADRRFDFRTGDAVIAFHKVQGMRRTRVVTAATWRRLADPRMPKPRSDAPRFHVEVDQTKQVLYVVRKGEIAKIFHASTGGPGVGTTHDGVWRVWLKFAGFSPKGLYMPAFFHEGRAIHGWPDVPPTAASHGCVRVPMWAAPWIYSRVSVGDTVRIYH